MSLIERTLALVREDPYVQTNTVETYEVLGYRKLAMDWVAKLVVAGYPLDDLRKNPHALRVGERQSLSCDRNDPAKSDAGR